MVGIVCIYCLQWFAGKGERMSLQQSRRSSVGLSVDLFLDTKMLNLLRHLQQVTMVNCPNKLNHVGAWNLTPPIATSVAGLDDKRATELLQKTTQLIGDTYDVGVLWAENRNSEQLGFSIHSALLSGADVE